jgi:UDP-4-amino-4,6-dideoxy-N-acetyl-beta-L-altrosamine N-acetyltransferase
MDMTFLGKLRSIHEDELELMRSWRNAPSVRANMYTQHEILAEEHRAWWNATRERSDRRYFMYEDRDGKPYGIVGFNPIEASDEHAFWAFYAAPDAPSGTGTFMEFLALDHAFDVLRISCHAKFWPSTLPSSSCIKNLALRPKACFALITRRMLIFAMFIAWQYFQRTGMSIIVHHCGSGLNVCIKREQHRHALAVLLTVADMCV